MDYPDELTCYLGRNIWHSHIDTINAKLLAARWAELTGTEDECNF